MKGKRYLISLWAVAALLLGCSESLEDTYSDYAGDGKIRYVAKCFDMSVSPGWQRLQVEWKNGIDAVIDKIKVSWSAAEEKHDSLLEPSATFCNIPNLGNDTYRVDVCAVDKNGNESLIETSYGRPYTEEHEAVVSFTRGIAKFYKVRDHLVFFMDIWNENFVEINLNYTGTDGKEKVYPLTEEVFKKKIIDLPSVDTKKPMFITRLGKLEGCPDLIHFAPVALSEEKVFTSDFKLAVQRRYGYSDQTVEEKRKLEQFIDTVRTLEFDYDMTTFEDVFHCPKLEKLVLGKNRYLHPTYRIPTDVSMLYEEEKSLEVLDIANRLTGLQVERYNKHYLTEPRAYIQEMGNPVLSDHLSYLPQSVIEKFTCSVKEVVGYDSGLTKLLDNDPHSWWEPLESNTIRNYELLIQLKSPQTVHGIKIVQMLFDPAMDTKSKFYLPGQVQVTVSSDNIIWKNASYTNEVPLGRGSGEVTLVPMAEPGEIKYVKLILNDQVNVTVCNIKLADIILY